MKPESADSSSVLKTFYLVNMCLLTWAESPSLFKFPAKLIFSYISFSQITTLDIKHKYVKTIQDSSNEGPL